ncbi:hypothetical protein EW145_g5923 [Phellinidium pouzarii]|uniref:NAD(P)-binding protein n=1 Tax=Phellinidium pouzarii TaxID=167371 RepID=A0A4S4KZJ0_9AGAM|nr:hypothetical protein EW145_g5923 [Phellinidium pouzarii]
MFRNFRMLYDQTWPPKSKFSIDDIPDLTGKVVIVTGGYAGVGVETVYALLRKNAKVYIAARNSAKAEKAIAELKEKTGHKAVEEFKSKETQLHILFNNGGVMAPPVDQLTADGYDLQFGTNVLGKSISRSTIELLLPTLLETVKSTPEKSVRVITTSSTGHLFYGPKMKWDLLKGDSPARRKYGTQKLYLQSKYGNAVFAFELARRYGDQGIISITLNPGNLKTELQRYVNKWQSAILFISFTDMFCSAFIFQYWILVPASKGALTQLWAGTMPETAEYNGKYLIPWARLGKASAESQDPETGKQLWEWFEAQVKDV